MEIKKRNLILFSFIVSAVLLTVGTASSPLFPYNVWDDANCFFTVGKSIFNGNVLYRDIFEQKGLYLYIIYGIGSLVSKTSFLGPFLLEVAAMTVFLYFVGKTMSYYAEKGSIYISLPLILALLLLSASFEKGGSAEEFCLPFFMVWICHAVEIFDNKGTGIKASKIFIDGIMFAVVFWIKFNVALIFVGGYLIYLIYFIIKKDLSTLWRFILLAIAGFIAGSIPCLIYFAVNNAFNDLWFGYFYSNLFLYHEPVIFSERCLFLLGWFARYIKNNTLMAALSILGIVGFVRRRKKTMGFGRFFVLGMTLFFWFACVIKPAVIGVYYSLPNILFAVFGFIELAEIIKGRAVFDGAKKTVSTVLVVICAISVLFGSNAAFLLEIPKEELAVYEFAQIIKKENNPTVLNYGCLDTGIYTLAEVDPPTKYFCRLNLQNFEEMNTETKKLIDEKKVDFIVTLNSSYEEDKSFEGYHQVAFKEQYLTGATCYHLYQKNK